MAAIKIKSTGLPSVPSSGQDQAVAQRGSRPLLASVEGKREVANSRQEQDMGGQELVTFSISCCYSVVLCWCRAGVVSKD